MRRLVPALPLMILLSGCFGSIEPKVQSSAEDELDRIYLTSVEPSFSGDEMQIRVDSCKQPAGSRMVIHIGDGRSAVSQSASSSGETLNAPADGTSCGEPRKRVLDGYIRAGLSLYFCATGSANAATEVQITGVIAASGRRLFSHKFETIEKCESTSAARIGFIVDETSDRVSVASVPSGSVLNWNRFSAFVASCTQQSASSTIINLGATSYDHVNSQATTSGGDLNAAAASGSSCGAQAEVRLAETTGVTAGEYLDFCASPTSLTTSPTQVKVLIRDVQANEIIYEHTFADIAECMS